MAYHQPIIHILIGPPGSGKSTWIANHIEKAKRVPVVIGSDAIVDEIAAKFDTTYDEVMKAWGERAIEKEMNVRFAAAVADRADIIVDRTNMTHSARDNFLARVPSKHHGKYRKIGVVFRCPPDILFERLRERERTGKSIPHDIVQMFIDSFEEPDLVQFDDLVEVSAR